MNKTKEQFKNRIFEILHVQPQKSLIGKFVDWFIISLITISVIIIIIETFDISQELLKIFYWVEIISVTVFSIEYILRLWTADKLFPHKTALKARWRYIFSFLALVDLFAILPFYLPFIFSFDLRFLRTFRLLRHLRLLKFNRYTTALITLGDVIKSKSTQIMSSMFVVLILMVIGSLLMYNMENDAQPEVFTNALSGFYWSIVTLTTVGYGDICPITPTGRILGAIISLLGLSLVAVPTGILSAGFIENLDKQKQKEKTEEKEQKHFCSYCGKSYDE